MSLGFKSFSNLNPHIQGRRVVREKYTQSSFGSLGESFTSSGV
jgi:hypothetical protein